MNAPPNDHGRLAVQHWFFDKHCESAAEEVPDAALGTA
jgi:hypothetical protein